MCKRLADGSEGVMVHYEEQGEQRHLNFKMEYRTLGFRMFSPREVVAKPPPPKGLYLGCYWGLPIDED